MRQEKSAGPIIEWRMNEATFFFGMEILIVGKIMMKYFGILFYLSYERTLVSC